MNNNKCTIFSNTSPIMMPITFTLKYKLWLAITCTSKHVCIATHGMFYLCQNMHVPSSVLEVQFPIVKSIMWHLFPLELHYYEGCIAILVFLDGVTPLKCHGDTWLVTCVPPNLSTLSLHRFWVLSLAPPLLLSVWKCAMSWIRFKDIAD